MLKLAIIAVAAFGQEYYESLEDLVWTFPVTRTSGPAPFRGQVFVNGRYSTIKATSLGNGKGYVPELILDLNEDRTLVWLRQSTVQGVGAKNYTASYLGKATGLKQT
jgi:hypothetical protein